MNSPAEERKTLKDQVDEARSMIVTILRNTELDHEQHGQPEDLLNRIRALRQYLAAYEDEDPKAMAMGLAVAMEMILEERR